MVKLTQSDTSQPVLGFEPKRYKALTLPTENPDPFTGKKQREVTGYYYKHDGPLYAFHEGQKDQSEHYIFCAGFADWNMTRPIEQWEIDPATLEEI